MNIDQPCLPARQGMKNFEVFYLSFFLKSKIVNRYLSFKLLSNFISFRACAILPGRAPWPPGILSA